MAELTISWPTAPLSPEQHRQRLESLAEQAESMIGRRFSLQDQATLAVHWLGLCWSGMSPQTIAASARASLLLGRNVVMAADPASQLLEVAERLDAIWEAAQDDPQAAVATVHPPLMELPPPIQHQAPEPPVAPPPPSWLTTSDVSELLGIGEQSLRNWRAMGRFGAEGVGWVRYGRRVFHEPQAVERLEADQRPADSSSNASRINSSSTATSCNDSDGSL